MDKAIIENYIARFSKAETLAAYDKLVSDLTDTLSQNNCPIETLKLIQRNSRYISNSFSPDNSIKSMEKSKSELIVCLKKLLESTNVQQDDLERYLNHFYFFLEAFKEKVPHKRATLTNDLLKQIAVKNEYDLQHLLYAALRPLYPNARTEVAEDTGVGTVRSDIWLPSANAVIEAKCTRDSMTVKKLIEEIKADIVHYKAPYIYFFIYDKIKLIENKTAFVSAYNKEFDGKQIRIIILQSVEL